MLKNRMEFLTCYTGVIQDNKLYMVHEGLGLLMEYDLSDFSYNVLTAIRIENMMSHVRVKGMTIVKNIIYMVLENSWNVIEYDIASKMIKVNGNESQYINGKMLVEKTFLFGDELWLLPCYCEEKIRTFNIKTKKYTIKKSIVDFLKPKEIEVKKKCFAEYEVTEDGVIYAIIYQSDYIVSIDTKEAEYTLYYVGAGKGLSSISKEGKNFWLSFFNDNMIVKWNPVYGILKEYEVDGIRIDEREQTIRLIYESDKNICVVPTYMPAFFSINKKNRNVIWINYENKFKRININRERYQFYSSVTNGDKRYILPFAVDKLLVLDMKSEKIITVNTGLSTNDIKKYIIKDQGKENPITEIYGYGIKEFINSFI